MHCACRQQRLAGQATATTGGEAQPGDIVLEVTITKEESNDRPLPQTAKYRVWHFEVTLSASLKRSDGTVIWNRVDRKYHGYAGDRQSSGPWNPAQLAKALPDNVCNFVAAEMVYGEP